MNGLLFTQETFEKRIEVIKKVKEWYYDEIPRFTVKGMNQAEFINHIVSIGFNRGVEFAEKVLSEKDK